MSTCVGLLCGVLVLAGCSVPRGWRDDHLVLNELQLLDDSDRWFQLADLPAEPTPCNVVVCQNVLRGAWYEVTGDASEAKTAALEELTHTWLPLGDGDPFVQPSSDFQLRDHIEINTVSGTAFMTVSFVEDRQFTQNSEIVDQAMIFTITSDIDPAWFDDAAVGLGTQTWIAVALVSACLLAAVWFLLRRTVLRTAHP